MVEQAVLLVLLGALLFLCRHPKTINQSLIKELQSRKENFLEVLKLKALAIFILYFSAVKVASTCGEANFMLNSFLAPTILSTYPT